MRSVSHEPQRGQTTPAEGANRARLPATRSGGDMPEARSFSRAASLIRSVDQAGALVEPDARVGKAVLREFGLDAERDHAHRRTAGIGRQDRDRDRARLVDGDVVQDPEVFDRQDRHLGVGHARRRGASGLKPRRLRAADAVGLDSGLPIGGLDHAHHLASG